MQTYFKGIETLGRHAFNSSSTATSHEALRCLANALLIAERTRQIFVDLGFAAKAAEKYKVVQLLHDVNAPSNHAFRTTTEMTSS
jgi:hypothetical protein